MKPYQDHKSGSMIIVCHEETWSHLTKWRAITQHGKQSIPLKNWL